MEQLGLQAAPTWALHHDAAPYLAYPSTVRRQSPGLIQPPGKLGTVSSSESSKAGTGGPPMASVSHNSQKPEPPLTPIETHRKAWQILVATLDAVPARADLG